MSYRGQESRCIIDFINTSNVQKCIEDLKRGKAAGCDGLMAEHVCFAHPILSMHLVYVFSMLYKHSLVPDDFGKGIIIPLLKNSDGNRFTSDNNYRGITLSPVMSKLFEMVLLLQFKDQLSSDLTHCSLDLNLNQVAVMLYLRSKLLLIIILKMVLHSLYVLWIYRKRLTVSIITNCLMF